MREEEDPALAPGNVDAHRTDHSEQWYTTSIKPPQVMYTQHPTRCAVPALYMVTSQPALHCSSSVQAKCLSLLHMPGIHLYSSLHLECLFINSDGEGLLGSSPSSVLPQHFHFFH